MNDDFIYFFIFLDFSNFVILIGELWEIFKFLFMKEKFFMEDFIEILNYNEGGVLKSMIVVVNFKWKFQYLLNSEFCSNFGLLKFREMFGVQLRIFVDGDERDVINDVVEER